MKLLGLDIGTNSVGSAWIDTEKKTIKLGVSVFPAGVEESGDKRGDPKNQARRRQRQQRRSIERRAKLKRKLRQYLIHKNWIPNEKTRLQKWENLNPWLLRREAVHEELKKDGDFSAEEKFGRILLHLAQRRGAWWFDEETDETEDDKKKKKDPTEVPGTVEYTKAVMKQKDAETFGELIAIEYKNRTTLTKNNRERNNRVRNRNNAFGEKESEFVADRHMILAEFLTIWERQKSFEGPLAKQLTDDCKKELYNQRKTDTWRCQGVLFSQRKAYWNLGTLGRCDLEPTDMKCPKADMYAQEFLVLTSINNIRITRRTENSRKLEPEERRKVISAVRRQKTASEGTIRKALCIHRGEEKTNCSLNTDGDKFTVNGDWFYSQIVCDVFGEDTWQEFDTNKKEVINRAILKFDPGDDSHVAKLTSGCRKWWKLDDEQTEKVIEVWRKRPKIDTRVNLSRKAIKNLLPHLREGWSVTEARDMYAEDALHEADDLTRSRYSTTKVVVNKRIRHFQHKHPDILPPVSEGISNPVVRKSIHEVRRHLMEYVKRYGSNPDRVGIELARKARQSERVIARRIQRNKAIDELKKEIIGKHNLDAPNITTTQRERAIERVRLCRQQRYICAYSGLNEETEKYACAYSGRAITEAQAVNGEGLEVDHIVPRSKGGDNGMSNLVLCYSSANQGKGSRTPIDWLSKEDFGQLELRFKHLQVSKTEKGKRAITKDTVDSVDNTKWENLHRRTPPEGFTEEQLRSSAYAATQTSDWINKVLYGHEDRKKRYVFASGGQYTGILRRDWGLFFDENGQRSEKGIKNRGDHRHHAVDAAIIAVTSQCLAKIKQSFIDFENQKENKRIRPVWKTIDEPWDGFIEQLAEEYKKLKVSHRAYNRQIAGRLHKDTLYGPAVIYEIHRRNDNKKGIKKGDIAQDEKGNPVFQQGLYIKSIAASELRGAHLKMPRDWSDWKKQLQEAENKDERKRIWQKMYALDAVAPGKSGIVRDVSFRNEIRDWLTDNGIKNIENIKKVNGSKTNELRTFETLVKEKGIVINGTPVRKVRLLWKLKEVKEIRRNGFDYENSTAEKQRKSLRVYQTQNNHHIEIREKVNKKGVVRWSGDVITNFEAATRARTNGVPIVDKSEKKKGKFVMSLSKGEVVYMKLPEAQGPDYFVVFKIDSSKTIHFTPHTDANPATSNKKHVTLRKDIRLVPNDLRQNIVLSDNGVPKKVKISPLGEEKLLMKD